MTRVLDRTRLHPIPAPPEPKVAYPEPQSVNVEVLSLIRGSTFFAAQRSGDLMPPGAPQVGLFHQDTRFLSKLNLIFFGQDPMLLSSTTQSANLANIDLTVKGGTVPGENLDLPVNTIYVHREQLLEHETLHDVLEIENFYDQKATLSFELQYDADFMDIFQVRGLLRGKAGQYYAPIVGRDQLNFVYDGLDDVTRCTTIRFDPPPQKLDGRSARWEVELAPHGTLRVASTITMESQSRSDQPIETWTHASGVGISQASTESLVEHRDWTAGCTGITTDNQIFNALLATAAEDFYALRLPEAAGTAIAAGVPWFAALFGRDSILASFQTLVLDPDLARGTLKVLASYQGTERNDGRDEDPGKIIHELRSSEMTATSEVAFGRNYGSVDSTPLFVMLAAEYMRWIGDGSFLSEMKEHIKRAVLWILDYADLDGDGLLEYCRRNPKGLFNQGWKDSGDAIRHTDGQIAQPPIALIEVQGYAIHALSRIAPLLVRVGEHDLADRARARAAKLQDLIEQKFWLEDRGYYAMALDRNKAPVREEGSNPGHLLFAEAIGKERAAQITAKLLAEGLFSGWGIRTLSRAENAFNPMSYHCGSVWPHDNSLICYGMARYGMHAAAMRIFNGITDAALHFREYRLPELFCGIQRPAKGEPVHYPVSCSPQAWASGSTFLMLTGLLGLSPDAIAGQLKIIDPQLPPRLHRLRLQGMRVGQSRVTLDFERQGERTFCNVVDVQGGKLAVSVVFR